MRREWLVAESLFSRLLGIASAYQLPITSSLETYESSELSKQDARTLAHELRFIVHVSKDPLLAPHIAGLKDVADFCWHADDDAG